MCDSQLLVTDVMSQPLASANVLVESAYAMASKSILLTQAPFTLNEYVSLDNQQFKVIHMWSKIPYDINTRLFPFYTLNLLAILDVLSVQCSE